MADYPIELDAALAGRLRSALDVEAKIPKALETLGPVRGRDVYLVDSAADGLRATQLEALGARVVVGGPLDGSPFDGVADHSIDVVVGCWTPFRGVVDTEMAEVARVLRPGGRLLVVHDYGRDDVSRLRGDRPEYGEWSRRNGPFLRRGFKIRVIHCFWTFESIEDGQGFLADAFGPVGQGVGAAMTRPRLSYNVAVYHRSFGEAVTPAG
jgi:SAM-dependent methyltransferase